MHAESLLRIFSLAIFFIAILIMVYLQRTKVVQIMDFQVGLRFRKGESYSNLSSGCYRTGAGFDPITVVDMRPHQFIMERVNFQDALHASSTISIGGELVVSDPQAAINRLKNLVEDSLTIVREGLCPAASHSIVDPSREGKEKLAAAITSEINCTLQTKGMMIRNLEITELWAQPVRFDLTPEEN